MGDPLRKEISQTLKAMEQGAFQAFCRDFLPLFDPCYEGLERHGGTADGKTRKGTPDLIKTLSNGKEIAAQCSVEENYWKIPKDKPSRKPCKDIDECINFLSNLQEIVLCSSQEIPTNAPNAKSEVIAYARGKTNAKITPLSCADIESTLVMRFVADLSVSQRLPYGGEFTAAMISTLIRDVENNITASEGSQIQLGLNVPFLRSAGHVAREDLIQLERDLTYAVRDFERFRRRQLVLVAQSYFDLLRSKQNLIDSTQSLERARRDYEQAQALEEAGISSKLETLTAEQQMLSEENRLEDQRESFRVQTDLFKLLIGMPVSEPMGLGNLEDIEMIEQQVATGRYPLLQRSPAMEDEERTLEVALQHRLDLLNRHDQIDDAKRGVAVARNALLPDLDWNSTLTFDTDPEHYKLGAFEVARADWRSELILSLPLERTRERNRYRASLIDVRRAQRSYQDQLEQIRVDVRRAINRIRLEDISLEIQRRNLDVSDSRLEFSRYQFYEGDISNRELIEAEDDWTEARNRLNLAKTSRWSALLDFRLATGTLRVGEDGTQHPPDAP